MSTETMMNGGDRGDVEGRQLSRAYATTAYRASRAEVARYSPLASGKATCDECAARQHETHGQLAEGGGRRSPAKTRRDFPTDGPDTALLLCREHTQLWRERDFADGVPA